MALKSDEIRIKFLEFWKKRDHAIIPNVSLVPQNDPTLLFVNSGMFPLVPYLSGEEHPMGRRLANIQRCIRTEDIDEVADNRHHTMFEMVGNWSLGDYFKKEQIPWFLELYVDVFGLDPKRMYVSVFGGNDQVPLDSESIDIWKEAFKKYDIDAEFSEEIHIFNGPNGGPANRNARIFPYQDNWWKRGDAPGELGGPDTELFYDFGTPIFEIDEEEHINSDSGRFIEIGNSVFMQYKLTENLNWAELPQKNVDFGGGFERIVAAVQDVRDNYETDLFTPIINKIEELSGNSFGKEENKSSFRIIADHLRAATFLLGDKVIPSNKDQGYILRRLIRRAIRHGRNIDISQNLTREVAEVVIENYKKAYPNLKENEALILDEIEKEEIKFRRTLERGLKEFERIRGRGEKIDGQKAFWLYETYGFPLEMILEEIQEESLEAEQDQIKQDFKEAQEAHQAKSRAGAEKKFTGGLADHSDQTTRLHTAHHLLLAALQQVLGPHVHQRGSNITGDRLRIDFSHTEKMTPEQIKQVEDIVNEKINGGWVVEKRIIPKAEAEKLGAEMEFGAKYGDLVSVYSVKSPEDGSVFSIEFCGGPHVENTKELAESGKFKIKKEQSSSAGVRRIKAVLE